MKTKKVQIRYFLNSLLQCKRVWDNIEKKGIDLERIHKSSVDIDSLEYIMIRRDGWSIACTRGGFAECHDLWPKEWDQIIQMKKPEGRHSLVNVLSKKEYEELFSEAFNIHLFGIPIYELERNELMICIALMHSEIQRMTDQHTNTIEMINFLNQKR